MIGGLAEEFSAKSGAERQEALASLMSAPRMHADFTGANVGGAGKQVLILANDETSMLLARDSKGHGGVSGSPLADYAGCVCHDHDKTFYSYGTSHQECMQHNIRYLIGSMQNEPKLTWNAAMLKLVREMIHWRNQRERGEPVAHDAEARFEQRYDDILSLAGREYAARPPSKYYRDGYNLSIRLRDYKESELRFLHDGRIPADNSRCERLARVFKRKMRQAIVFRSFESLGCACEAIGAISNMRARGKDVFAETGSIFNRPKPRA